MKEQTYKKLNPPFSRLGGKSRLRGEIIKRMPEHHTYIEAFSGACWVMLGKPPSKVEVVNDIDRQIYDLLSVVKFAGMELAAMFQYELSSRRTFDEYLHELRYDTLSPVERAFRYLYLSSTSFASLGEHFGYSKKGKARLNVPRLQETIRVTQERLQRVHIECLDFRDIIKRYDSPESLFYFDPPYYKVCCKAYPGEFIEKDYFDIRDRMNSMQGKSILSLNDHPFTRETFKDFRIEEVQVSYSINKDSSKDFPELIIENF